MMSEGQVRQLLATLKDNYERENDLPKIIAFSGGVSALEMVLEEGQ